MKTFRRHGPFLEFVEYRIPPFLYVKIALQGNYTWLYIMVSPFTCF